MNDGVDDSVAEILANKQSLIFYVDIDCPAAGSLFNIDTYNLIDKTNLRNIAKI